MVWTQDKTEGASRQRKCCCLHQESTPFSWQCALPLGSLLTDRSRAGSDWSIRSPLFRPSSAASWWLNLSGLQFPPWQKVSLGNAGDSKARVELIAFIPPRFQLGSDACPESLSSFPLTNFNKSVNPVFQCVADCCQSWAMALLATSTWQLWNYSLRAGCRQKSHENRQNWEHWSCARSRKDTYFSNIWENTVLRFDMINVHGEDPKSQV